MERHPSIAAWLSAQSAFQEECALLIRTLRQTGMEGTIKWGSPTWVDGGHNVANIGILKECVVVGFFRGALLTDPHAQFHRPGDHSRHTRLLRFRDMQDIAARRTILESYLEEAVHLTRAGRTVPRPDPSELQLCAELGERLDADPAFAEGFWGMTPGRRRGHALHINGAKTPNGRRSRIASAHSRIIAGKGRQDCICGRSQRMPRCDGPHRRTGSAAQSPDGGSVDAGAKAASNISASSNAPAGER